MEINIVLEGRKDLTGQIERCLRKLIRQGDLTAGTQLPPSRVLAESLGVSRKTVSEAYQRLSHDDLVEARHGSGSYVRQQPVQPIARPIAPKLAGAPVADRWRNLLLPLRHPLPAGGSRYEFIGGAPDNSLFPHEVWRRCVMHACRQGARGRALYGQAEGLPELREAVARHVAVARGVRCSASDVIITNGAQQALDLIARVLVRPGDVIAVEEPGYPPARHLFEAQGANVVGIEVDSEGIRVDLIPEQTRLIYTTPSHQFPLGMPMSVARRKALISRATELGAIIIEDDYDSEFRFEGSPTDSLQGMDGSGLVAFVGTFSKALSPELRLGFVVAPGRIVEALGNAKHLTDWHTAPSVQWALAKFMNDGDLQRHLRRAHNVYAQRRQELIASVNRELSSAFELIPIQAGFHMAALAKRALDVAKLIHWARRVEVGIYPLDVFYMAGRPRQGLMFGFGAIATADIAPALSRVGQVLRQLDGTSA
ncbi:PLP-dependent aminotransferase family protein [Paucibacter sp. R3-3]|uniref:PLP-dependent aminotransferase family protein n=1 Tax=Roseateles agri TaxID=3098619 RepID=A0ABU5DRX5_9BURK|nr:PLP-dependent aminotransferase family protein [Paucibacter sp. R3-3]MDY0749072.1 PLP-dependent aminotransferase family protein [Paucibacter sp. R3-3]